MAKKYHRRFQHRSCGLGLDHLASHFRRNCRNFLHDTRPGQIDGNCYQHQHEHWPQTLQMLLVRQCCHQHCHAIHCRLHCCVPILLCTLRHRDPSLGLFVQLAILGNH